MRYAGLLLMGAAFTGCTYRIVDCIPDQREYIRVSKAWVFDSADIIDARMEEKWLGERLADWDQVLDALVTAEIQCGVGSQEGDGVAASHFSPGNRIVIDVSHVYFLESFQGYLAHRWVTEYSFAELDNPETPTIDRSQHPSPINESLQYATSLGLMALLLTHEPTHEVIGDHTPEAHDEADEIRERVGTDEVTPWHLRGVDEIHAIGWWALDTSQLTWSYALDDYAASTQEQP